MSIKGNEGGQEAGKETAGFEGFRSVDSLIDYINEYLERGDIGKVAKKVGITQPNISRLLKKKVKRPQFAILRELKKIADRNYAKVN